MSKNTKSMLGRNGLAGRVPPPAAAGLVQRHATSLRPVDTFNLWDLEAPALEYHADLCDLRDINGCPTLVFAAVDPLHPGILLNAVFITFPRRQFDLLWTSLHPLRADLGTRVQSRYGDVDLAPFPASTVLQPNNMRRFHCATARVALNDDVTMADFYSISPYVKEQGPLSVDVVRRLAKPCIRIFMTPVVFAHLVAEGDAFVGRGQ